MVSTVIGFPPPPSILGVGEEETNPLPQVLSQAQNVSSIAWGNLSKFRGDIYLCPSPLSGSQTIRR